MEIRDVALMNEASSATAKETKHAIAINDTVHKISAYLFPGFVISQRPSVSVVAAGRSSLALPSH
jgi:hypothetical protein